MSDLDSLRVRIVKLPAALAEAMLYHGLRENDPALVAVLAQAETVLMVGVSPPAADKDIVAATGDQFCCRIRECFSLPDAAWD